jgi:hypothetical protein
MLQKKSVMRADLLVVNKASIHLQYIHKFTLTISYFFWKYARFQADIINNLGFYQI